MNVVTVVWSLVIVMFIQQPDESIKTITQRFPIDTPVCQVVDGVRVEDSTCGVRYCMKKGREKAAELWGKNPGARFDIMCFNDEGKAAAKETSEAGGGHPALGFEEDE